MEVKYLPLIKALTEASGAPGFEHDVVAYARTYAAKFATTEVNSIQNLYIGQASDDGRPRVMLDAHSDEVGFLVQCIHPNGTLGLIPQGGIRADRHEGTMVQVRSDRGEYLTAVISCRPPHFSSSGAEGALVLDLGACSAAEVRERFHVSVGAPCVPFPHFHYDTTRDLIFAKGLDCRIGCAALLATMEALAGERLPCQVVGALTAQEEVGDRGAEVAVRKLQPAAAIVFEGAPADDTYVAAEVVQCGLKKGPMLRLADVSAVANPRFVALVKRVAEAEGIPLQLAVRAGGGTNAGAIQVAGDSVPVIVLSVPVRYIHAPTGIASYEDFENTVKLAVALVRALDDAAIRGFC